MIKFEGLGSDKEPVGVRDLTPSTNGSNPWVIMDQTQAATKVTNWCYLDRREDQLGKSSNHSDKL